jgi:type I restriction enzyme S subunit
MQKEKSLVPQLRFSEFEGEWRKKKLENVCSFFSGGTPTSTKKEYYTGNIAFIGSGNIFDSSVEKYISEKAFKNSSAKIVGVGDILYALYGANSGDVAISKLYGAINQAILCIRTEEEKKFLYQVLTHKKESIVRTYLQGGQGNLSAKIVKKIKIRFPKKEEQQKIANFLSAIDKRIQTLVKKKTLLEQYKKGVMQKIFKQELRFKDDTSTSLSTSDGKAYPEWEEKKLGKLTYKVGKKNKENISYPIYSINNQEGFRPQSEQFEGLDSNDRGYDISLYKIVNKETFAYNPARINVGSIGYSFELNEVIISSLYVCFKTNKELEDLYLLAYLDTNKFNKNILRYEEGGVRQYLFYENFSQIKIPLPSNAEQTKIANFLSAIDISVELVTKKIEHTKTFKKGLLQQMFV